MFSATDAFGCRAVHLNMGRREEKGRENAITTFKCVVLGDEEDISAIQGSVLQKYTIFVLKFFSPC